MTRLSSSLVLAANANVKPLMTVSMAAGGTVGGALLAPITVCGTCSWRTTKVKWNVRSSSLERRSRKDGGPLMGEISGSCGLNFSKVQAFSGNKTLPERTRPRSRRPHPFSQRTSKPGTRWARRSTECGLASFGLTPPRWKLHDSGQRERFATLGQPAGHTASLIAQVEAAAVRGLAVDDPHTKG